jgi:uncharacterized protein (AIM24 family)
MNTYICRYCRQPSDPNSPTCPLCGAPVDIRSSVSDSGWVEQPAIKDMARLQFGQSHLQIAGTTVPVAEFNLAPNDWIYFSHHVLLWTDPATRLTNMPMRGAWNRKMAGMPLVMVEGRGPGHLALSDNHAGEVIALPLQHGQQIWVREHRFLCATGNIRYDWYPSDLWYETGDGNDREMHYPMGQFGDVFGSHEGPGLLLLHAPGNAFVRDLQPGQSLLVQPSALLYRDVSVRMSLHLEYPRNMGFAFWHNRWSYRSIWARLFGPGRVAVQSVYQAPEDTEIIVNHSYATTHHWQPAEHPGGSYHALRVQGPASVQRGDVLHRRRAVGGLERGQLPCAEHVLDPVPEGLGTPHLTINRRSYGGKPHHQEGCWLRSRPAA